MSFENVCDFTSFYFPSRLKKPFNVLTIDTYTYICTRVLRTFIYTFNFGSGKAFRPNRLVSDNHSFLLVVPHFIVVPAKNIVDHTTSVSITPNSVTTRHYVPYVFSRNDAFIRDPYIPSTDDLFTEIYMRNFPARKQQTRLGRKPHRRSV